MATYTQKVCTNYYSDFTIKFWLRWRVGVRGLFAAFFNSIHTPNSMIQQKGMPRQNVSFPIFTASATVLVCIEGVGQGSSSNYCAHLNCH
jgi:hypothetical protein